MIIHKEIELDIIKESKCDNYIDEHNICNNTCFIVLIVDKIKSYYCIECDMDDLKNELRDNVFNIKTID